ncbi:MAG TPA: hypothetical protein VF840_11740, partial [Terriglobales bacterium]
YGPQAAFLFHGCLTPELRGMLLSLRVMAEVVSRRSGRLAAERAPQSPQISVIQAAPPHFL